MKNENIYNAISDISPEYLEELTFESRTITEESTPAKRSRLPVIAIICAVVGLAGITSAAAIKSYFGRGMNQLQIDESQLQELVEQSAAIIYTTETTAVTSQSSTNTSSTSQTSTNASMDVDAITVEPVSVVADERCAYISFRVHGFTFDERNNEPLFDQYWAYEDESMTVELDCDGGTFYNGINRIGDDWVYEDGTPVQYDDRGMEIYRYFDDEGYLYFMIKVSGRGVDKNMLGSTVYLKLINLYEDHKCSIVNSTGRDWTFALEMPTESTSVKYNVDSDIGGTDFHLDDIEISPISVRLNYTIGADADLSSMPYFSGVVLKDGTTLGIGDDVHNTTDSGKAYQNWYFVRAIDPGEVASIIIFSDLDSSEPLTIPVESSN